MRLSHSVTPRAWPARLLFASIALAGLLTAAPGDDAKIEKSLLATLSSDEDATASFFVVFGEKPDLSLAGQIKDKSSRGKFVGQALKDTAEKSQAGVRGYLQGHKIPFTPFWVENKIFVPNGTLDLARELAKRNDVVAIIPEVVYSVPQPQSVGSVQSVEWGVSKIRADQVWPTTRGAGIVVANIDTGVQYNHPALVNQYRGNTGSGFNHTGSWYDPTGTYPAAPGDNNGHGTHTMGTMVGSDGGSNLIGVAPGAKWIACKGCGTSTCDGSALIACAQWVLDPQRNQSFLNQPDVVNNSWAGGNGNTWYQSYINNWRAAGIFPAFANGNAGPACSTANSPGDNPVAFASGATASDDTIASFSSRGPSLLGVVKPDVSAPGVSVRSTVPTDSYAYYSGTSMASPHTAGSVALIWAAAPGYLGNVSGTEQLLRSTAVKLTTTENCGGTAGVSPNDTFGSGRIDVLSAVQGAGAPPNQPPTVHISSPGPGTQPNCGNVVTFTGTASDPEQGNLAGSIRWTEGAQQFGTGGTATRTFDCTGNASELHTIYATVKDSGGLSASDNLTITVVNPAVPAAPTNLKASSSNKLVTLTWSWSGTGTGFRVERKPKTGGSWAPPPAIIFTGPLSATDTPGTGNWQYRVFALNGTVPSASSNIVSLRVK